MTGMRIVRVRRASPDERGAVLILVALLITALFVIAALVIDLSFVRQNRQADKSAADFAAAAGIRALDDGEGRIQPWKGICAARSYLLANSDELAGMVSTYANGDGSTTYASDPCTAESSVPFTSLCVSGSPSSWGVLTGSADGGRIRVTIKSGYSLPDPAFSEDLSSYSGDDGAALSAGCDHLAVIIEESEGTYFGGVAGASGYETVIRSVSRLVQGPTGDVTAALVLLERNDCDALSVLGNGAWVRIEGNGTTPGVIHSDSLGNVDCGKIFSVNGSTPPPRIVVANADAVDPVTSTHAPGQISAVALMGADPGTVSDGLDRVCAQVDDTDCGSIAPVDGQEPVGRDLVGRTRVDTRYRLPAIARRTEAADRRLWTVENPPPEAGWTVLDDCGGGQTFDAADPGSSSKLLFDCGGGDFIGNGTTFAASIDEVVINGTIRFTGSSQTLHFKDVRKLLITGASSGAVKLGSDNSILVNDGGLTDGVDDGAFVCDDRYAASPSSRAEVVVWSGDITSNGGELRLCQTTLLMMDTSGTGDFDTGSGPCPIPATDGLAPYDNGCTGKLRLAGTARIDWTAPNLKNTPTDLPDETDFANFEDLAFWSETAASSATGWGILGTGGVQLSGIFFTPNADPFRVGGGGAYDIEEAQFITRKLVIAGGGTLKMKPDAHNSVKVPVLGGFTLVR